MEQGSPTSCTTAALAEILILFHAPRLTFRMPSPLDASLYFALTRWLEFDSLKTLAKGISYEVGTLNSFYWNRSWTFKSGASTLTTFAPFALANLAGLAINAGAMHICLNALALHEIPWLVLATGITLLWNFAISKFLLKR